jgi:hypothetical protein
MINKKELPNNQGAYINSLEKRLNEAVSPAGGGWGWTVAGDIAITQVSAKKDILSSEELNS